MRTMKWTVVCAALAGCGAVSAAAHTVIPCPERIEATDGTCELKELSFFVQNDAWREGLAEMLSLKLGVPTGLRAEATVRERAFLRFLEDSAERRDAYALEVDASGVTVRASSYGGHFYALQTLLQLLPREIKSRAAVPGASWRLPCVRVHDAPRFGWRGMMLDVSRHWFTKEEVKAFIDEIAEYKFNVFHWHLTDDQGWRVQIDAYPRLAEVGSRRVPRTGIWRSFDPPGDDEPATYGGYYTKDDIREVVAYAARRNVDIMPEVDVPGHSQATLVACPELACHKAPTKVDVGLWMDKQEENTLCAGNEATFRMLEAVFGELAELFPFAYVHAGGDECRRGFWKTCPKCQKRMADEHLKDDRELQSYFMRRVGRILAAKGRKLVGWDEILDGGLAEGATVMSWRGTGGGIRAAKAGHQVIMTPRNHCYIDLYQGDRTVEPASFDQCRISACYKFEPVPKDVDPKLVLGGQGNLWGEFLPHFRHAEYMSWPRGWALAETLWSPGEKRDWPDFVRRVEEHFRRAKTADVNCADRSMYTAIVSAKSDPERGKVIAIRGEVPDVTYRYTLDETNPDLHSPLYSEPLTVPKNAQTLKVQGYRNGREVGYMLRLPIKGIR